MRSGGKISAPRRTGTRRATALAAALVALLSLLATMLPTAVDAQQQSSDSSQTTRVAIRRPADTGPEQVPTPPIQWNERLRVIVDFDPSVARSDIRRIIADTALRPARFHRLVPHHHTAAVTLERSDIARLRQDPRVLAIQIDALARQTQVADISDVVAGADTVGAPRLWAGGRTGAGSVVAVIDSGVDDSHPFLAGKVVAEACFSSVDGADSASGRISLCPNGARSATGSGSASPLVPACVTDAGDNLCGHGTHVAGIIAGSDPATGASGVAPDAKIIAVQVFHRQGDDLVAYTSDIVAALAWLDGFDGEVQGRRLAAVNLSLGGGRHYGPCDNDARKPMIDALVDDGVLTIVASGNSGWDDSVQAPACVTSAIAVAASDAADQPAFYTNVADMVDVFAPGSNVTSSVPGGGFEPRWGTSAAAPHVAGAAALFSRDSPNVTQTRSLVRSSAVYLCEASTCKPRLSLAAAFDGSPGLQVSVTYSSAELAAVDQAAAELGRSPEELQRIAAGLFGFLLGGAENTEKLSPPPVGSDATVTSVLTFAELDALDRLARAWGVQRDGAVKVATMLIVYLLSVS